MLRKKKKEKKIEKTERGGCCGAQSIMGGTIKIAVVFTQHGVGLVRSASRGLTQVAMAQQQMLQLIQQQQQQ